MTDLLGVERPAWTVALGTWVLGDLATTGVGLSLGAAEANPLADSLIGALGPWVLIPVQLLALGVFGAAWWMLRERDRIERVGIPIGLSILGTLIVANNLAVIAVLVIGL